MGKSQYVIQFGGLPMGEHQFEFEITQKFFEQFNDSEITKANIDVTVTLIKQNSLMQLLFDFEGTVNVSCDRCLIEYDCPISGHEKLIVKHGNVDESNDEILVLKEGYEEADISQYLFEYIELAIPSRRVPCEDDASTTLSNQSSVINIECDEETLKKFEELKVEEEPKPNENWDALKKIKFNNN
jgi:uncharacterized metal-binding protein YceD (DUF177 family)